MLRPASSSDTASTGSATQSDVRCSLLYCNGWMYAVSSTHHTHFYDVPSLCISSPLIFFNNFLVPDGALLHPSQPSVTTFSFTKLQTLVCIMVQSVLDGAAFFVRVMPCSVAVVEHSFYGSELRHADFWWQRRCLCSSNFIASLFQFESQAISIKMVRELRTFQSSHTLTRTYRTPTSCSMIAGSWRSTNL